MGEESRRRLRFGMVGGGRGSLIGGSHRIAARLDDRYELVAGALDLDAERGRAFGVELGVEAARCYPDYRTMIAAEAARPDGVEVVAVVTPNATHVEIAGAFVEAGVDVICEKPLATDLADARRLAALVERHGVVCAVMYGYSGYPMVRQARALVEEGALGTVNIVMTEFAHGHMAVAGERDNPAMAWRVDPAVSGPSYALADTGTHALHLAKYITGQRLSAVAAELRHVVAGRPLEDDAHVLLRFDGGAGGSLWASAVAAGNRHGLRIRVYGDRAGLEWHQEAPERLTFLPRDAPVQIFEQGGYGIAPLAARPARVFMGHPEGYFEAFANVYRDVAEAVAARRAGTSLDPLAATYPGVADGIAGVAMIDAALRSAAAGGAWTALD